MRIIILSDDFPPPVRGGAIQIAYLYAREYVRLGHSVLVVTTVENRLDAGLSEVDGIRVERLYSKYRPVFRGYLSLYNPRTVRRFAALCSEFQPDVVHAHNIHWHLSYAVLKHARKSGARVFLTAHDVMSIAYGKIYPKDPHGVDNTSHPSYKTGFFDIIRQAEIRYNPFRSFFIRRALRYCDRVFAVSDALREVLESAGISNVETFHNGIDIESWDADESIIKSFRQSHGLAGKRVLLFSGRLGYGKGGTQIPQYLAYIRKRFDNVVVLAAGASQEITESSSIIATGWLSGAEYAAAFKVSDIVIVPSLCFDSLPTTAIEAGANCRPAVVSCFGGGKEIVIDNQTGRVANPYNISAFSEAVIDLLADPDLARSYGAAGRDRSEREFNIEKRAKALLRLYQNYKRP